MAVQSATALYRILVLANVAAAQTVPLVGAAKNPLKGQYNLPGRMAGWEDYSKLRAMVSGLVLTGVVTTCEITIGQFLPSANANPGFTPLGKLVLQNGVMVPVNLGMIGPGSYAAYVNAIAGGGNVSGDVNLQAFNDDQA